MFSDKDQHFSSPSALWSCLSLSLSHPSARWDLINRDRDELSLHHSGNLFFVPDKDISPDTSP